MLAWFGIKSKWVNQQVLHTCLCWRIQENMLQAILMALSLCRAQSNANTGIPHFIALYRYCVLFFLTQKVCGHPLSSKSVGVICQQHLLTLGFHVTFWQFSQYFSPFHYCHGVLWSVIFDATIVIIWSYRELCSCDGKVNPQMSVFWLLHSLVAPSSLSLSLGLPIPWDTTVLKLGQLMTLH